MAVFWSNEENVKDFFEKSKRTQLSHPPPNKSNEIKFYKGGLDSLRVTLSIKLRYKVLLRPTNIWDKIKRIKLFIQILPLQ